MKGMSIDQIIDYIVDSFVRAYNRVKDLITKKIGSLPDTLLNVFNKIKMAISKFFGGMGEAKQSGKLASYIIQGLINGLKGGAKGVFSTIANIAKGMINIFKTMFGIHSPSKVFMALGGFLLTGLVIGIRDSGGDVLKAITNLGNGILDRIKAVINWIFDLFGSSGNALLKTIKQIDLNNIISALLAIGGVATLYAFAKGLGVLANGLKNIVDLAESTSLVMKKFAGVLTGIKYRLIGAAFHDLARGILEIAIAVLILSKVDSGKMLEIFGFIAAIAAVVGALVWVISILTKVPDDKKLSVNMLHVIGTILAISVGMLLMAIALKKLASLKMTLDGAILIAGLLITFITSLVVLTKFKSSVKDVGTMMLGIGVAFFLISKAFKTLADLDGSALLRVAGFTLILGLFIAGMMAATQLLGRKQASIEKIGSMMMKIGVTFILIAMAVKIIGNMKPESFEQAMKAIKLIGSFVITLVGVALIGQGLVKGGKIIENIGKMMLQIGASFLLISIAIGILGKMKFKTLIQGFVAITVILGLILGFIYVLKKMDVKEIAKVGATMAGIALAVVGIAVAFLILSFLDWGDIFKGLTAIAGIFAGLAVVFKAAAGLKLVSYKSILAIAAVVAVLAIALAGLSFIDPERLVMPMLAMISVMLTVSVLMKSISKIGDPKKTILNLLSIAAFVVILGGVITGLSFLDPVGALAGVIAISALMLVTTKVIENVNKMKLGKTLISKLAIMVGFMAMVAIVINTLNGLNPESVIAGALGVAILMATCAGILIVLDKLTKGISIKDVLLGVVGLVAVLGACWIAIQVLKAMNGIDDVEQKVTALVTFMIGMSLVLVITALVGTLYTATAGIAATGLLGLAALLLICVGVIAVLQAMNNVKNAEKNTDILMTFLGKLSAILLQIGIIAPLALMAVAAIGALMTLITIFGVIITAFGALIEKFPMLETFVDTGIKLFIKMAEGLGEILAAFVTGFLSKTMELLPMIGQKLSEFMINATPFILGCKLINGNTLEAVGILVASILALTVTSLIEGIVQFLPFSKSFADMGKDLADFMTNAMPFIEGIRGIDPIALECVGNLATAILKLTAANLLDQLAAFLGSRVSLADFGREIAPLGTAMRNFISNIGTFGDAELQTTEVACKALAELADAGSKMRKTGGLKQFFGGTEEDLGSFAIRLPIVATGIKSFINTLTDGGKKGFGESQLKTVEAGANVVKTLAEAAAKIPDNGFSFKKLVAGGDSGDIEEFVQKFPAIARAIRKFVDVLNNEDIKLVADNTALFGVRVENVGENTQTAFKISEDISKALEGIGGFIESLAKLGEIKADRLKEVSKLATDKLPAVGRSIRGFIEALNGEDIATLLSKKQLGLTANADQTNSEHTAKLAGEQTKSIVTLATELINALAGFNGMDHNDLKDFSDFSKDLPAIGGYLNAFIDALINGISIDKLKVGKAIDATQVENIKSLVESAGTMITSLAGVGNIDFDKIKGKMPQYKTDLTDFASAISEFVVKMKDVTKEDLDATSKKVDTIKTISDTLSTELENQVKSIKTNFMDYIKQHLNLSGIISGNTTITDTLKKEAGTLLETFKKGLDEAKIGNEKATTAIRNKMTAVANDAIIGLEGTKDAKNDNTTAGKAKGIATNVLTGFLNGLQNTSLLGQIYTAAYNVGAKSIQGLKDGSGVKSPSKYGKETGNYIGQGLIIGIEEYSSRVYDTSSNVGKLAVNGLNEAVASMSSLIETGIDSQPTIRPVLDLSNVQNGISSMNSMFDNSSIGVLSNLRTVSSEMNSRNQNGRNSDVVSAINKLGNTLNDSPKNTYNINGITYDGDSTVNQAVQQLINAIEIERRV
jgi:hemerythrin superfamily protein